MLREVDELTSERHSAEPRLRTVSVWVGDFAGEQELTDHLSPDDPASGLFAGEVGEEWYDSDALEATFREKSEAISELITRITEEIGLPEAAGERLLLALAPHSGRTANAVVLLHGHVFEGESPAGSRLLFAGSVDYLAGAPDEDIESAVASALARPAPLVRSWQLFFGVAEAATSLELQRYAREGGLLADLGGEAAVDTKSFDPVTDVIAVAHGLESGSTPLVPADFFALPAVTSALHFESPESLLRAAARREIESANALIAVNVGPLKSGSRGGLFCGLGSIGVHRGSAQTVPS